MTNDYVAQVAQRTYYNDTREQSFFMWPTKGDRVVENS